MPIYKVTINVRETETATVRLIEADTKVRAFAHIARDVLVIKAAKPADLIALTKLGVEVENVEATDG